MLIFSKEDATLTVDSQQEWLETNGLGSYASSTILGYPTRRYHGLLVAQLAEPYGKYVLLSHFEEHVQCGAQRYPLSLQSYDQYFDTQGFTHIDQFCLQLCPRTIYRCDKLLISKEILFLEGQNTVLIKYQVNTPQPGLTLQLRPFLAYRPYHDLATANTSIRGAGILSDHGVRFSPYEGMPDLSISSHAEWQFLPNETWYYNFFYREEKENGYGYCEDLFSPGVIELNFDARGEIIVACTLETELRENFKLLWQDAMDRRAHQAHIKKKLSLGQQLKSSVCSKTKAAQQLGNQLKARAATQLIVEPVPGEFSIDAGYHWFTQWGRDAMIALPGLTLYSGKEHICLQVLSHFAAHESQGMIPNRIAPLASEQDEYDSIDASMFFCWAVQQYYLKTQDLASIQTYLWPALKNIIRCYQEGTRYGIHQASNGLIYGGHAAIKLTWMDVMIDGVAITPRNGAAVEINALWYNALCFVAELAQALQDPWAATLQSLIPLVKQSFFVTFWDAERACLYDFVNEQEKNSQLRPNQIFAASLPYCVLEEPQARVVIDTVVKHLLTPYGLRTLAASDLNYHATYYGDQTTRDRAYHNGTVWPWLLGPLSDALLKFYPKTKVRRVLQPCVAALWQHLNREAGIECVSEIFDGDAPHRPRGCIQQAWSVAEIIRMVQQLQ